jgi:hypothetical protein
MGRHVAMMYADGVCPARSQVGQPRRLWLRQHARLGTRSYVKWINELKTLHRELTPAYDALEGPSA